jgi:hypothetical protein
VYRGVSLRKVGHLLGPTQAATTQRYKRLQDAALRDATNVLGEIFKTAGKSEAMMPERQGFEPFTLHNLKQLHDAGGTDSQQLQPIAAAKSAN